MSFVPADDFKGRVSLNLAPMIDFLFLMLIFFATLAVTRATTKDTGIELVEIKPETKAASVAPTSDIKVINLNIDAAGNYKWVTEIHDYPMASAADISQELISQYEKGQLPVDKAKTQLFLKIDKQAQWEPILQAIFAIRDAGFDVRPVYEPSEG
jgi:biopolymer transport protein ExbD